MKYSVPKIWLIQKNNSKFAVIGLNRIWRFVLRTKKFESLNTLNAVVTLFLIISFLPFSVRTKAS